MALAAKRHQRKENDKLGIGEGGGAHGGWRGAPWCGEAVYRSAPYRHELRRVDCGPGITNITETKEKIGEEGGARGGWRAAPPCTRCSEDIDSALQSRQPVVGPSYSHATGRTLAGPARSPGGGGREELGVSVAGSVACVGGRRAARSSRIIARIPLSVSLFDILGPGFALRVAHRRRYQTTSGCCRQRLPKFRQRAH